MTIGKKAKEALNDGFMPAKQQIKLKQGEVLRILREKNELSQNELADLSGIAQSTISSIENHRISLGVERSKVLAKILNVHPAVLVFPDWVNNEDEAA